VLRDQVNRLSEELLMLRAEVTGLRALIPPAPPPLLHQPVEPVPNIVPPVVAESSSVSAPPTLKGEAEPPPPVSMLAAIDDAEARPAPAAAPESSPPPLPPPPESPVPAQRSDAAEPVQSPADPAGAEALARLDARVFPAGTIGLLVGLAPVDDFHRLTMMQERLRDEAGVESVELSSYEFGEARLRLTFRMPARGRWLRETIERAAGAPLDPATIRFEQGMVHARLSVNT
jgi:hypothetical protein